MTDSEFNIALRNYAGVPVVELVGEINKRTMATLSEVLGRLVQAGHYNVMLNLKHAVWGSRTNMESLKKTAQLFQTHYGNVDLIVDHHQIEQLRKLPEKLFRFCTSEGQALTRIKRIPAPSVNGVTPTSVRLTDTW